MMLPCSLIVVVKYKLGAHTGRIRGACGRMGLGEKTEDRYIASQNQSAKFNFHQIFRPYGNCPLRSVSKGDVFVGARVLAHIGGQQVSSVRA